MIHNPKDRDTWIANLLSETGSLYCLVDDIEDYMIERIDYLRQYKIVREVAELKLLLEKVRQLREDHKEYVKQLDE